VPAQFALPECSVLQLVAAGPGWHAQYREGSRTNLTAVALWALVETGEGRRIVGIGPGGDGRMTCHAEEIANFDRYVFVSAGSTQIPGARAL
jgi:hypothetical protein